MIIAMLSQFHIYLPCLGACLALSLKCGSASRRFQPVKSAKTDGSFSALVRAREHLAARTKAGDKNCVWSWAHYEERGWVELLWWEYSVIHPCMIMQRGWCQRSGTATLQCTDKTREADLCIESAVSIEQTHGGLAISLVMVSRLSSLLLMALCYCKLQYCM